MVLYWCWKACRTEKAVAKKENLKQGDAFADLDTGVANQDLRRRAGGSAQGAVATPLTVNCINKPTLSAKNTSVASSPPESNNLELESHSMNAHSGTIVRSNVGISSSTFRGQSLGFSYHSLIGLINSVDPATALIAPILKTHRTSLCRCTARGHMRFASFMPEDQLLPALSAQKTYEACL